MENKPTENKDKKTSKTFFIKELKKLMNYYSRLDAFTFFKLIHAAYEITLQNPKEKDHIFYHIHNPDASETKRSHSPR